MGVLFEYFHGPDAVAVAELMDWNDGNLFAGIGEWATEVVGVKTLDPSVCVGALCSFIVGVGWAERASGGRLVWPVLDHDELMEHQGPWVEQLSDEVRDALAGVDDDRIPGLAARWVRIEEVWWPDAPDDALVPAVTDLVALARAARAAGRHLYCWISL